MAHEQVKATDTARKRSSERVPGLFVYAVTAVTVSAMLVGARIYKTLNDPWDTRPTRFSSFYRHARDALVAPLMVLLLVSLLLLFIAKAARRDWLFWVGFVATLIATYSVFTFVVV